MKKYKVFRSVGFQEEIVKYDKSIQNRVDKIEDKLVDNSEYGSPLGVKWFRESRFENYRVYYLIYEDLGAIFIVAISNKKDQQKIINTIKLLRKEFGNIEIIAGNVATREGAEDIISAGADCVKAGVGGGSVCITRIITGSGVPQLTAIMDCVKASEEFGVPIIADGGIRNSGDIVKSIAAGANSVMLGSLLAGTEESPGTVVIKEGKKYKIHAFKIFLRISCLPFQSKASFKTSLMFSTGMILIFFKRSASTTISFKLDLGTKTCLIPASMAASTLLLTPPTGKTSPLTESEPVMAISCLIGTFFNALIIAVATAMLALSPSTPS